MTTLTIQGLKDYFSTNANENEFFSKANQVLHTALDINFDNKEELSDWVNAELDSDDFDIEQDTFTDGVNDIVTVVAEFYNLD